MGYKKEGTEIKIRNVFNARKSRSRSVHSVLTVPASCHSVWQHWVATVGGVGAGHDSGRPGACNKS